ncbi:PIN domain-containing protein [Bradyrhizobium sp. 199]|uniref:type II toxin-antitoxin system VapC family toxin n=1 Tax=Bradyrhizobium sp. 199 TaxID=2782664 RepID=UPI001FF8200D|nr:PIN domain-containing protein [Bradyrhizobium sp. 199]
MDTSVWFAAVAKRDRSNALAKAILQSFPDPVMTDHVLAETWMLLRSRFDRNVAETFWDRVRNSTVRIEPVVIADLEAAWAIGVSFPDQDFSFVDRTSFAVMERLGITRAASFDEDFSIYRYGRSRDKAFEIVRSSHSAAFEMLAEAILKRAPVSLNYNGVRREVCPYILGHTNGQERALVFQFGGLSRSKLPAGGEWRCLTVAQVSDVEIRKGEWRGASYHRAVQRCVDRVYLDVNEAVPNQPGRRLGYD